MRDDVANVPQVAAAIAGANGGAVGRVFTHAIKGFSVRLPDAAAAALARHSEVLYVEQNQTVHAIGTQTPATWGIDRIDQRDRPLNNTYNYGADGSGVDAYIIDTGIRFTHSEFEGRAVSGTDEIDNDSDATDCNGHGTHVSGTVGGKTYGVAKKVRLIGVRVLDCGGSGTDVGVIAGIDWVTANHVAGQPAVANMSLGGGFSQALNDAVRNSVLDGVVYAVASGNGYKNPCIGSAYGADSPASEPTAITVGATDINDVEASFSNRGPCLDIYAPGVNITSSWLTDDNSTNTISGTSMATPHVVGALALYVQAHPTATADEVDQALTANASLNKVTLNNPFGAKTAAPGNWLLYTAFISAGPPPSPPLAPADLSATGVSYSRMNLAWTDASDNEDGFKVERCLGNGCTDFAQVAQVGAGATSYQDTGLSANTTYTYQVRSFNAGGSNASAPAIGTTLDLPPAPAAPSGLSASASSTTQINLVWTSNSTNEDGFKIERCTGAGCTNFTQIAQVGAGVTSYSNTGLSSSTTYRYQVRAFNVTDNSGYSNTAAATTLNQAPVARYTWNCKNTQCSFNGGNSSDPDGSVSSYAWNFGDGQSDVGAAPSHTYATKGTKNVVLTVTDNGGATGTRTCAITASNGKTSGTCQ